MSIIKFLNNFRNSCFLLFIPVIIFNILFTKYLPEYYLKNVNHPIVTIETVVRIIVIMLSLIMVMRPDTKIKKAGLIIYIFGVLIYFCSYFLIIKFSATSLQNNLIVLLSPYWTSILWLIGIGLSGAKLFVNVPYHYSTYIILSVIFVIVHSIHGYICLFAI